MELNNEQMLIRAGLQARCCILTVLRVHRGDGSKPLPKYGGKAA